MSRRRLIDYTIQGDYPPQKVTCMHRVSTWGGAISVGAGVAAPVIASDAVTGYFVEHFNMAPDGQCCNVTGTLASSGPPLVACVAGTLHVYDAAQQADQAYARFNSTYDRIIAATAPTEQTSSSKALNALGKIAYDEAKNSMSSHEKGCFQQKCVHISTAILAAGIVVFTIPSASIVLPCVSANLVPGVQGAVLMVAGGGASLIQNHSVKKYQKVSAIIDEKTDELEIFAKLAEEVLPNEDHPGHARLIDILGSVTAAQNNLHSSGITQQVYHAALISCAGILAEQKLKAPTTQPMSSSYAFMLPQLNNGSTLSLSSTDDLSSPTNRLSSPSPDRDSVDSILVRNDSDLDVDSEKEEKEGDTPSTPSATGP